MILPDKSLERKLLVSGYNQVIAVDEVGMGCLAGPVVVCAALLPLKIFNGNDPLFRLGVRDSKQLSAAQRERIALALGADPRLKFQIGYAHPKTIDRLNIYQATRLAMKRAVSSLVSSRSQKVMVLVDGNKTIAGINLPQQAIIKGDQKVFSIAAASIIAKVYRDKLMRNYAKRYPAYGFDQHKGYGTKLHLAQLAALGPSVIHRKSFAPVSNLR